jgi:hypothetical protein
MCGCLRSNLSAVLLSHQQIKHIGLTLVELRINLENSDSVDDDDSAQQAIAETKRSSKRQRTASITSDTGSESNSTARTTRSTRSSRAAAATAAAAGSTMDVDATADSLNDTDVSLGDEETDTDAIDTPVTATTPKKSKRVSGYLHVTDAAASAAAVVAGTQAAIDAITALGDADSIDSHILPPWHPFAKVNK